MPWSFMECPRCHERFQIYRKPGKRRKKGHVKHMWCWKCKAVTPHRERY